MSIKAEFKTDSGRPFLIQLYFVAAALIGLILIIIGAVNIAQLGLKSVLGVKDYPDFRAPYPVTERFAGEGELDKEALTEQQRQKLAQWEKEYDQWQVDQQAYNSADQNLRREIATSLAMLIVGVPVFAFHAPYVFRKNKA